MSRCPMILCALIVSATVAIAEDAKPNAAFEQMKSMVGDWTGSMTGEGGKKEEAPFTYRLTAGGSALVETIFAGTDHEMVSVYTVDKGTLVLTHYCMMGNQPHMKMDAQTDPKVLSFTFDGGGNMASDKDAHMHTAKYAWTDADHVSATWSHWQDGKATGDVKIDLTRNTVGPVKK